VLDSPLIGTPNDPNHGRFFRDFRAQAFVVDIHAVGGRLLASEPRLLFGGPKGTSMALGSALNGWPVYEEHDPSAEHIILNQGGKTVRRSTLRVSGSARHNKAALALTMKSDVLGHGRYFVAQSPKEKLMKFRVMAIVFAATLALGTGPHVGTAASVPAPTCQFTFCGAPETCYAPRDVRSAEWSARLALIDPSASVSAVLRLPLTQVIVTSSTPPGRGRQIHYLYGRIPGGQTVVPIPSPLTPEFLVVEEASGQQVPKQPSITRSGPRPWIFTAYLPGRRLSILVTSNASRTRVERVGRGILAVASRGK